MSEKCLSAINKNRVNISKVDLCYAAPENSPESTKAENEKVRSSYCERVANDLSKVIAAGKPRIAAGVLARIAAQDDDNLSLTNTIRSIVYKNTEPNAYKQFISFMVNPPVSFSPDAQKEMTGSPDAFNVLSAFYLRQDLPTGSSFQVDLHDGAKLFKYTGRICNSEKCLFVIDKGEGKERKTYIEEPTTYIKSIGKEVTQKEINQGHKGMTEILVHLDDKFGDDLPCGEVKNRFDGTYETVYMISEAEKMGLPTNPDDVALMLNMNSGRFDFSYLDIEIGDNGEQNLIFHTTID